MDDDTLTQDSLGIKAGESAYDLYKAQGASGATYDVYCAATHGIQLRSKNSDSGIIAHLADGACKSITFVFDNNTYDGADRTVEIYGSNTAFGLTQMFNGTMTAIGTVSYDNNNLTKTYTFTTDYSYIGIRTRDGAIYFTSIQFIW